MNREVILTNSNLKAFVSEEDYENVSKRSWFLDGKYSYTNVIVYNDNPESKRKPYRLKIRMDRYIYRITTHNHIEIRHPPGKELYCTRIWMFARPNKKARKTRGMTKYLGVYTTTKGVEARYYRDGKRYISQLFKVKRYAEEVDWLATQDHAARHYDKWALKFEGFGAKTNFLPASIYK